MDIEKLIEQLHNFEACAYGYHINGEVLGVDCSDFEQVMVDAAEEISKIPTLQAENKRLKSLLCESGQDLWSKENQRADRLEAENEKLRAELEQVKRERDAAVEYLRGQCRYCKNNLVCTSRKGPHFNCWEWRGPKKED